MPVGDPIQGQPAPSLTGPRRTKRSADELVDFDEIFREIFGAHRLRREGGER